MRAFVYVCLVLLPLWGMAANTLPAGCQALTVQGESVTVPGKKAKLIFIHNLTKHDLWITHPVTDTSASAGWTTRLQADNWSALVVDKPPFVLNCIESRPGHEQQIPCEAAIGVCSWKKAVIPESKNGTFWASEDMSLDALSAAVGGKGFVLH